MTTNRSASGKRFWLLALGFWACLSIAGCSSSGSAGDRGAGDVSPAATPATSATPASGGSSTPATTTPATTTPETTTTATPVPSDTVRTRKPSEVSIALLDTYSFVPGVHVVATPTGSAAQSGSKSGAGAKITSDNPKCAPFLAETNTGGNAGRPGVTGYASITFQADGDATPFLIEEITTVGAADHVADLLASLDDSIHGCTKLTMSIPGAKSSTMTVSPAPAPPHGDHPTAGHIVGSSGASKGIYLTVVATGVQDAVITLTFIQESESDIQGITKDAVERATAVFAKPA